MYSYVSHNFFIHSPADGHSGCFRIPAVVNSAAVKRASAYTFQVSEFWVSVFILRGRCIQ